MMEANKRWVGGWMDGWMDEWMDRSKLCNCSVLNSGFSLPYRAPQFLKKLNVVPPIKFTHEISNDSLNFLDTTIIKDASGRASTDVYQKPTDTHPYLHWTSAHSAHLKYSLPYRQALRLRRIGSSTDIIEQRIMDYSIFFCRVRP